jgi:hypothetical protein
MSVVNVCAIFLPPLQDAVPRELIGLVFRYNLHGVLWAIQFAEQALHTFLRICRRWLFLFRIPLNHVDKAGFEANLAAVANLLVYNNVVQKLSLLFLIPLLPARNY